MESVETFGEVGPDWSSGLVEDRLPKGVSCPLFVPLLPGWHEVSSLTPHTLPLP